MNITKVYDEKKLTMTVDNRIDTVNAPDFENAIMDEMGNFDSLTIDFAELKYISSSGLRVLLTIQKKLQPQNIPFTLVNTSEPIKEIFSLSGFDKLLDIQ